VHNAGLFVTLRAPWRPLLRLYEQLAGQGILLRWCHWPEPEGASKERPHAWLRCGLPPDNGRRLQAALESIINTTQTGV